MNDRLPQPQLSLVYHLEARLGEPLDLGDTALGRRRIVPLTAGTFTGPEISGRLLPGASADWQTVLPDATALADLRYTLQTDPGHLLYVQSHGVRHGSPDVLARLARGEDVDPGEYIFRTTTRIANHRALSFRAVSTPAARSWSGEVAVRPCSGELVGPPRVPGYG